MLRFCTDDAVSRVGELPNTSSGRGGRRGFGGSCFVKAGRIAEAPRR